MFARSASDRRVLLLPIISSIVISCLAGCASVPHHRVPTLNASLPKETAKISPLAEYDVGVSDILSVEVARLVPKSPYKLESSDEIRITAYGLEDEEIKLNGNFRLQPGGMVAFPPPIGSVSLAGLTCEEAGAMLADMVCETLGMPEEYRKTVGVSVDLQIVSGLQPISGEHMVGPDGRINLGIYGSVDVAGLPLSDVKEALEFHLAEYLDTPKVAVDVYFYNSKSYYVVMEGAGFGDKLVSYPYTGNETVLDAIAEINGMDRVSSKRIWIARSSSYSNGCYDRILPVDWQGVTSLACHHTNYQLMPDDRIFIEEDKMVAFDTKLSKIIAPLERVMGFSLLGAQTATRFSGSVLKGGGDPSGGAR